MLADEMQPAGRRTPAGPGGASEGEASVADVRMGRPLLAWR